MFSDQNKIQNSTEEDMSCASVLRDEDQLGLCFAIQMLPCSCLAALLLVGGRQHQRRWSATIVCSKAMNLASLNSILCVGIDTMGASELCELKGNVWHVFSGLILYEEET